MKHSVGYRKGCMEFFVDKKNLLGILKPNKVDAVIIKDEEIKRALLNPIGSKRLSQILNKEEKVVIITSDITRPMPSSKVLPFVIEEILKAGVKKENITIVLSLGSHRKHTEKEKIKIVGKKVYENIKCIDSDSTDCVHLGETSFGTPVDIFRPVAEADRRICLGNIEYHYFAGYSGGAKAVMPGVSSKDAIQSNHKRMVMKKACTGNIKDNPVRNDIDEAAKFVSIDFILNVVLDENKEIMKAFAGHYIKAHREGCRFLDSLYKIPIKEKAEIVLVSPGGFPKDINLYQAQKALDNSKHAVKDRGIIILCAACTDGLGEKVFEKWMLEADKPSGMLEKIQKDFQLGGHKAAAIAMILEKADIYLVSDLDKSLVENIFMKPFGTIDEALAAAFKKLGRDKKVLIMPYGGSTLPFFMFQL